MTLQSKVISTDNQAEKKTFWLGIGLLFLYLLIYLVPLGNRPLVVPDETRYAEIPREMLVSNNWVSPRLNNLRYFEKPPLGYWANAVSLSAFGENPFSVRLSSALAAGLTTLLIYLFVVKTFGSRRKALLATLIHMTFFEVYIIGTFSVLDNLLTLFLSAGIMTFYLAVLEQKHKLSWVYWSLSGISLGLAFLTKGFLALAVPVLVLVPWMVWQGYWRPLLVHGWYVVLVATLIALPWGLLIHFQENDFWHYFFWVEHIKRFAGENAQHKAPFYYFLVTLPIVAFPWFSLVFAAKAGLRSTHSILDKNSNNNVMRLLWLWLLLPFLFFSVSSGKLITYILPCFPAFAIIMAVGLSHYLQRKSTRLFEIGLSFNLFILAGLLIALIVSQFFDVGFSLYRYDELSRFTMMSLALFASLTGGWWALKKNSPEMRLALTALHILPFIVLMQFASPNLLRESKAPGTFLTQASKYISKDTLIVTDGAILRAVNWYLKREDAYLFNAGEVSYGLNYEDATGRLLDPQVFAKLVVKRREHSIAVFCRKGCPDNIQVSFPENSQRYSYGKFSMWLIPKK